MEVSVSYPRSLDEYNDVELKDEIKRREKLAKKKRCTYCEQSVDAPACRFPERHSRKGKIETPEIVVGDTAYELTEAFCRGALALHSGIPYNTGNPYDDEDDRHQEWNYGHEVADDEEADFTLEKAEKALAEAKRRKL
jgi:hypothetical protein